MMLNNNHPLTRPNDSGKWRWDLEFKKNVFGRIYNVVNLT